MVMSKNDASLFPSLDDSFIQNLLNSHIYSWISVGIAFFVVFSEPFLGIVQQYYQYVQQEPFPYNVQNWVSAVNAGAVIFFACEFFVSLKGFGTLYLKTSAAWINILVVIFFLIQSLAGSFAFLNPLFLRILRTVRVIMNVGLMQRTLKVESKLASKDIALANEDDIKYSIFLVIGLSLLPGTFSIESYQSIWDPIKEVFAYGAVLLAIKYKARKNEERVRVVFMDRLNHILAENKNKLESLLGKALARTMVEAHIRKSDRDIDNEFDLIIEQINLIFIRLKMYVSDRTLRESRGEVVIPVDQPIAMTFTDVEDFTSVTEAMGMEVIPVLGMYLENMSKGIKEFGGDIEKFIGDAIFIYHYNCLRPERSADQSFDSALRMMEIHFELHERKEWEDLFPKPEWKKFKNLKTRIGMHLGPVTAGTFGESSDHIRAESTLIGDSVNLASRMETICKKYGVYILITDDFFRNLSPDRRQKCRLVDYITVKGRENNPLKIFTVDVDAKSSEFFNKYEKGLQHYFRGDWRQAFEELSIAHSWYPADGPTQTLLNRIKFSRTYSLKAVHHLQNKFGGKLEEFEEIKSRMEEFINREHFSPPPDFIPRGGFWRWEEK